MMIAAAPKSTMAWPAIPPAMLGYAVMAVAITALSLSRSSFPLDDAYITLHNARVLLAGGIDPTYAGATALTGTTSAVHVALLAMLGLIVPLELASRLVGLAAIALLVAAVDGMAVRAGVSRAAMAAAALLTAYQPYHLLNGLETGLALAAVAWALVLADHRLLPLLCGVLPFVRPELALLSAPLMARRLWLDRAAPRRMALDVALAIAGALPWMMLYLWLSGSPMPNTASAKIAFFAEQRLPAITKLWLMSVAVRGAMLWPLLIGLVGLRRAPAGWCVGLFLVGWLGITACTLPGGLQHNHFRYLALTVPMLLYGWAHLLPRLRGRQWWATGLAAWSVATCGLGLFVVVNPSTPAAMEALVTATRSLPAGTPVLVHDAGYIAWRRPDLRLTDIVGLKSPASEAVHRRLSMATGRHDLALAEIARTVAAHHMVVLVDRGYWQGLADDLRRLGWHVHPIVQPERGYAIVGIDPPG